MNIDIFPQQKDSPMIAKDSDTEKFQKIATILCEKRKQLEESLQPAPQSNHDEILKSILELNEEMKNFGVNELDYQKYLLSQKTVKA